MERDPDRKRDKARNPDAGQGRKRDTERGPGAGQGRKRDPNGGRSRDRTAERVRDSKRISNPGAKWGRARAGRGADLRKQNPGEEPVGRFAESSGRWSRRSRPGSAMSCRRASRVRHCPRDPVVRGAADGSGRFRAPDGRRRRPAAGDRCCVCRRGRCSIRRSRTVLPNCSLRGLAGCEPSPTIVVRTVIFSA